MYSLKAIAELLEHTGINNHLINLKESKQPSYRPIYSLELIELETLKTYIKDNPTNSFIRPSKSSARAPILFVKKVNGLLQLYVNYQGLNNIMIKNRYLLPLIDKLLNCLE